MLTRFGTVSVRGLWRGVLKFPTPDDGSLTDLTTAVLEMRVTPEQGRRWRDDYGWIRSDVGVWARPALTATTTGAGQGTLALAEPNVALFYFPAEAMRVQCPGIHEISVTATVGPETSEILRDIVVFD